jgi:hypothetical protein
MSPLTESTRLTLAKQSVAATDTNIREVSLLLHGNQSGGEFVDSSLSPNTVTKFGNTAPGSPGGGSPVYPSNNSAFGSAIAFDGNEDYIKIAPSNAFNLSNDFTIETWIYLTGYSATYAGIFGAAVASTYLPSSPDAGWQVRVNGTASTYNTINLYTGRTDLNFAASFSLNNWTHLAVSRSGLAIKAFVNGVQAGSTINNSDPFTRSGGILDLRVGGLNDVTYKFWLPGFLDDLRITKGVARYTANFTPPTAPFPDF